MAAGHDAQAAGERVEALLAELRDQAAPRVAAAAEELVGCLVELYGAGLAAIVEAVGADPEAGPRLLTALTADPLVESLLLLHDLHPLDPETRVRQALAEVMPQLGSHAGQASLTGIDEAGVAHLRLERGGHGCGSPADAVREALTTAASDAAPELTGVEIEMVQAPAELPLLQIGLSPARGAR